MWDFAVFVPLTSAVVVVATLPTDEEKLELVEMLDLALMSSGPYSNGFVSALDCDCDKSSVVVEL